MAFDAALADYGDWLYAFASSCERQGEEQRLPWPTLITITNDDDVHEFNMPALLRDVSRGIDVVIAIHTHWWWRRRLYERRKRMAATWIVESMNRSADGIETAHGDETQRVVQLAPDGEVYTAPVALRIIAFRIATIIEEN